MDANDAYMTPRQGEERVALQALSKERVQKGMGSAPASMKATK